MSTESRIHDKPIHDTKREWCRWYIIDCTDKPMCRQRHTLTQAHTFFVVFLTPDATLKSEWPAMVLKSFLLVPVALVKALLCTSLPTPWDSGTNKTVMTETPMWLFTRTTLLNVSLLLFLYKILLLWFYWKTGAEVKHIKVEKARTKGLMIKNR